MDEKILSIDEIFICQKHPWTEKSYPWIKMSSIEKIMDNFCICGCHRWIKVQIKRTDDAHGRSHSHSASTSCIVYII